MILTLGANIDALVDSAERMVVATTFASNIARVKTLAQAGMRAGRSICLMGRAMRRMVETALETGVLNDFPTVVSPEDAQNIPRENLMLLVTGSQGERRAASAQLAQGKFQGIKIIIKFIINIKWKMWARFIILCSILHTKNIIHLKTNFC